MRPARHWRRLFLVDAATGATREVSPPGVNVFEVGWAGGPAVAVCTDDPSESAWYGAWVGRLDLDARTADRVHTPRWQLQCPSISAAGSVAWIEGFSSDRGTLTGTVHLLGVGAVAPDLDATWIDFAAEDELWCAGWRGAGSFFGRLARDGEFRELGGGEALIGPRFGPAVAPSADGSRIATTYESATEPAEVVVFEGGERRSVTALNAALAPRLETAEWSTRRWTSFDGQEIEGLLALPRGHANGALPLLVMVHGGPTGSWPWSFAQGGGFPLLLAAAGYATFMPNPRGSVGRGPAFAQANLGDMGGGDLQDILTGVDSLVRDGIADDARVAIGGGSYGGFMASWAVTQTDRFAASIPYAVVTNWLSFHNTTNVGEFDRLFLQADPYDAAGEYTRRSPVYHAARCRTPTLILHGADDLCTTLPQATEFYNALVEAGCADGAGRVPARGPRVHRARAPDRLLDPRARVARPAPRELGSPGVSAHDDRRRRAALLGVAGPTGRDLGRVLRTLTSPRPAAEPAPPPDPAGPFVRIIHAGFVLSVAATVICLVGVLMVQSSSLLVACIRFAVGAVLVAEGAVLATDWRGARTRLHAYFRERRGSAPGLLGSVAWYLARHGLALLGLGWLVLGIAALAFGLGGLVN